MLVGMNKIENLRNEKQSRPRLIKREKIVAEHVEIRKKILKELYKERKCERENRKRERVRRQGILRE